MANSSAETQGPAASSQTVASAKDSVTKPVNFDGETNMHVQRASLINFKTITVVVGEDNDRSFVVHQDLICHFSPFFRAACHGPWKESQEGVVALPEDAPSTFEHYVKWLYTGELVELPNTRRKKDPEDVDFTPFVYGYFLGDKLLDFTYKNTMMDAFIKRVCELERFPSAFASVVYENTTESSPLRRLLVDFYVYAGNRSWLTGEIPCFDIHYGPREFLKEILVNRFVIGDDRDKEMWPWVMNPCQYHDHFDGIKNTVRGRK